MLNIEQRLECAQTLNTLLKQTCVIRWPAVKTKKGEEVKETESEEMIQSYVRLHLTNLLTHMMGEIPVEQLNQQEVAILKEMVARIKGKTP